MKELYEKYVGKTATISLNGLTVRVMIKDVKLSYGKERYDVTPIAGEGSAWVENVELE